MKQINIFWNDIELYYEIDFPGLPSDPMWSWTTVRVTPDQLIELVDVLKEEGVL